MTELLKYTIPSLILFAIVIYILHAFFKNERQKRANELALKNNDQIIQLKIQAFERMLIFLERISPESMIVRCNKTGFSAQQLHTELLNSIRAEYEHNLSQQLYISEKTWRMINSAKLNIIKLINTCADKIKPNSSSLDLSKLILESVMTEERLPTREAMMALKEEFYQISI
jgi:hypothetical protein